MTKDLNKIKLFFVACNGRSGSTLLQSIFDAHPNICAPIEAKFMLHLATKYKTTKVWNDKTIARFCNDLYTNRKYRLFWNVERAQLQEHFSHHTIKSFQDACKVTYLSWPSVFEKGEIRLIIDKNPLHSYFLPELQAIYPHAHFIHLIRDPRAVYCSQRNAFHKKLPYMLAQRWNMGNSFIMDFKAKNPGIFLTLVYEDLVKEPETHIKRTMDFLDLPFFENLLSGHKTLEKRIDENTYLALPHHRNIAQPIDTKHTEKWKNELSKNEMNIVGNIASEMAGRFGYAIEKKGFHTFEKWKKELAKCRVKINHYVLKTLFKLPFWMRKRLYGAVSLFFDKKYKK